MGATLTDWNIQRRNQVLPGNPWCPVVHRQDDIFRVKHVGFVTIPGIVLGFVFIHHRLPEDGFLPVPHPAFWSRSSDVLTSGKNRLDQSKALK